MADNLHDLALIIKSRFPLVQVETSEEVRMMRLLERAANLEGWPFMDEIFFVDLPDAPTREEIFRIHLQKRKLDPAPFDLTQLAMAADGFSGAEIEQTVVAAIYEALADKKPLATEHVLAEIGRTRPLSVVMAEKVEGLREWAAGRTVRAD